MWEVWVEKSSQCTIYTKRNFQILKAHFGKGRRKADRSHMPG